MRSRSYGTRDIIPLGRNTRRAVAQRVDKNFEDEDDEYEDEMGATYGKQRVIASNNGLTVSTVSSPIFETRKLFPLIFP